MITERSIVQAHTHNVSVDLESESVILDTASGTYFGVDTVGKRIWELLAVPRTVASIHATLTDEFDVEPQRCMTDLLRFLNDLHAEGLIEARDDPPA
ncbi:MAG: PqqD family protein [Spirochaetaceae bacterium]|nr:MAG: PqqD family protein [Spirochaetaceae bacterium]